MRAMERGNQSGEAEVLDRLGELFLATGRIADAYASYATALDASRQAQYKSEQPVAHDGLAQVYYASADPPKARRHWQQALALYTEIGAPEADEAVGFKLTASRRAARAGAVPEQHLPLPQVHVTAQLVVRVVADPSQFRQPVPAVRNTQMIA